MHSLEEVRAEYDRLDRLCGVDTSGIELKISKRAVKQLGSFRCLRRGGKDGLCITLSYLILEDDEQFWDTVRHEYAHAAVYLLHPGESHGHDKVWKDMCRRIGCSPERLAPEKGQAAESRRAEAKYLLRCAGCGRASRFRRGGTAGALLRRGRGRALRCTGCGGSSFKLFVRK